MLLYLHGLNCCYIIVGPFIDVVFSAADVFAGDVAVFELLVQRVCNQPCRLHREPNKMMANTVRCSARSMVAIGERRRN